MSEISEELRNVLHAKERVCTELAALAEHVDVSDYAGTIAALCADYSNAGTIPQEYSEVLDKRFSEALEAAKKGAAVFEPKPPPYDKDSAIIPTNQNLNINQNQKESRNRLSFIYLPL